MRILAIGDVVDPVLSDAVAPQPRQAGSVDVILSCGDLPADYLTALAERFRAPLFYVLGNHDGAYWHSAPQGCTSLDGRLLRWRGLRLFGFGGAPEHNGGSEQHSEAAIALRLWRYPLATHRPGGIDIVVTHAPPRLLLVDAAHTPGGRAAGHRAGREASVAAPLAWSDPGHRGFAAFGRLLARVQPQLWLHGHTHLRYGTATRECRVGGTRVVNVYGHCLVDVARPERADGAPT
ncbi:MAG TPA: metallophosphoesterase [Chloroflexota bacterium]|nr:metallophosphoesterase [Chloroflexota bacterium]